MKKMLIGLVAVSLVVPVFAKEATVVETPVSAREDCMTKWTPFALTLFGPIGLPWGYWNVAGLQIGIINSVNSFSGLQIGAVNIADHARGCQIGVFNVISTDDISFLPVFNWSF